MSKNSQAENKKEIRPPALLHPWRIFGWEAIFFCLCLFLGILAGLKLHKFFEIQKISPAPISLPQFLSYFLLATLFLLSTIYFFKFKRIKGRIFKLLFILAIAFGNLLFFGLWLPGLFVFGLVGILIYFLVKKPCLLWHNLALIFAAAGVGAALGLRFSPQLVLWLLLIFSVYDFIAVYKTKHMVKMAEEMAKNRAIVGFIVPQKISDFRSDLKEIKLGGRFLILGGGDVVFPLIFAVSLIPQGIAVSLIVASGSLIGLLAGFLIFISQKIRQPMPALPSIVFFSIIGYLLTRII